MLLHNKTAISLHCHCQIPDSNWRICESANLRICELQFARLYAIQLACLCRQVDFFFFFFSLVRAHFRPSIRPMQASAIRNVKMQAATCKAIQLDPIGFDWPTIVVSGQKKRKISELRGNVRPLAKPNFTCKQTNGQFDRFHANRWPHTHTHTFSILVLPYLNTLFRFLCGAIYRSNWSPLESVSQTVPNCRKLEQTDWIRAIDTCNCLELNCKSIWRAH